MDMHRIARVIQSLTEVERDWLNAVLDTSAHRPASLHDIWGEAWFSASSARGLIIHPPFAAAFFYVSARAWPEHVREIERTLKVAMLFDLLVTAGLMQVHHSREKSRSVIRCIGAIFSEPRMEVVRGKPRIVINQAGDYTEGPTTIVNSAGEVLYRSARLGQDAFDLLEEATHGMLQIQSVERAALLAAIGVPDRPNAMVSSPEGRHALNQTDVGEVTDDRDDDERTQARRSMPSADALDTEEHPNRREPQEVAGSRIENSGQKQSQTARMRAPSTPTRWPRYWLVILSILALLCVLAAEFTFANRNCNDAAHKSEGEAPKTSEPTLQAPAPAVESYGKLKSTVAVNNNSAASPLTESALSRDLWHAGPSNAMLQTGPSEAPLMAETIGAFIPEGNGKEAAIVDLPQRPLGLDVSKWSGRGKSGAEAVFSVAPRIDFAFARVAYGKWPDPEFLANRKIMKKQGVYRGAYLFFRLDQDPIEQVDVAVGTIGAPAMRDLCLTIDIERAGFPLHASVPDIATADRIFVAALQRVQETMKCIPIIYTDWETGHEYLSAPEFGRFPLWIADWTNASSPKLPPAWSDFTFWQRSDHFHNSPVPADFDIFNGSIAELQRLVRLPIPQPASSLLPYGVRKPGRRRY
ncbi:glycoside hydrolase family 25 protein [Paraburkholderia youngii]|uniref:glycoside hydrolase family 25 protein n=1 Tax=Paraburkholderia youngii TaxID=2782701 RepID=UPI003D1FFE36